MKLSKGHTMCASLCGRGSQFRGCAAVYPQGPASRDTLCWRPAMARETPLCAELSTDAHPLSLVPALRRTSADASFSLPGRCSADVLFTHSAPTKKPTSCHCSASALFKRAVPAPGGMAASDDP